MREPFKNCFLVLQPVGLVDTAPRAFKARCCGGLSLRCQMQGSGPLLPREKLRGEPVTCSIVVATRGMGVMATLRLRPLLATRREFFCLGPVCGSCSASSGVFISEAIVPHVVVQVLCLWEEVNSAPSHTAVLS